LKLAEELEALKAKNNAGNGSALPGEATRAGAHPEVTGARAGIGSVD
jgi:hypothetical protein